MAQIIQELLVQPQSLGEVFLACAPIAGPTSYLGGTGNGQIISPNIFGLLSGIRFVVAEDWDSTETYTVAVIQPGKGATKNFRVRWYTGVFGPEVVNGTNLSASIMRYMAIGN